MKKLLLSLGAIASVAAPIAAVVACGTDKPATPAKTNGSAGHGTAPKVQPEDEGFSEGSLIENFDINAESQKISKIKVMKYAGKIYASLEDLIAAWTSDANIFLTDGSAPKLNAAGYYGFKTKVEGEKITLTFYDKDGNKKNDPDKITNGLNDFNVKGASQLGAAGDIIGKWILTHKIEPSEVTKSSPLKNSIDSIIYSQAQSLTNTVETKGDTATFSTASKVFDVIAVPDGGYTEAITNTKAGSFEKGDSITFAFDKERDLKSFTQRVGYLDAVKGMFASNTVANHAKKLGILDGTIYSYEARDGAPDKTKAIFKLEVVAKNAVKLTFINPDQGLGPDKGTNQFLMLNGFKDINGDGIITSADKGISNPFDYK